MKNFIFLFFVLSLVSCGKNGVNGTNGLDGTSTLGLSAESTGVDFADINLGLACANGGISIYTFHDSNSDGTLDNDESIIKVKALCNGINVINGTNGTNGANGTNGTNGTMVTPVKFCSSDNSTFPEYGLMIGNDLYAVYWGSAPASPHRSQAFLTKLVAGNYQSTGGNNCLFTIH
jgi:hypothetical protein